MFKLIRTGVAALLTTMVFVGNVVAGDDHPGQDASETPTTKGMGVSGETTTGTATEGSTTADEDSLTPEEAAEEDRTGTNR